MIARRSTDSTSRPVVACVCYRRKNGKIEFLLVRTRDRKYWTFPKGHVERQPPESPWMAAKREAKEEAGVTGTIDTTPLTSYAYRKHGDTRDDTVAAYLMSVESESKPEEPKRKPGWFTLELAMKKLSEKRQEKYAREHERVIKEAFARLTGRGGSQNA